MLEMMKQGFLRAWQEDCFGPILVAYIGGADLTAEDVLAQAEREEEPAPSAEIDERS